MKPPFSRPLAAAALGSLLLVTSALPAQEIGAGPGPAVVGSADGEVLTRGPVHEAFAAVVNYQPQAGIIVDRQPPEPIEEIPPEERPVGDDVAWIPGYWGWDDERGDFIWISGTWRVLPPGRAWIAGYWRDTGRGAQWISGYWADATQSEVTYLPPPPETLERGPDVSPPSPDYEWAPGCWEWHDGRYAWRPGYWMEPRQDWVWTPSYYVWTPRGYVFVAGYWDYAPEQRGLLFAPVYYRDYGRRRYEYRPSVVLNLAVLADFLFLRPGYCHYYFGDYYDARYEGSGFFAEFSYQSSRRGYDPFYSYEAWRHRDDRNWERQRREAFDYRRRHEDARPPRTWSGSTVVVNVNQYNNRQVSGGGRRVTYAESVQQYARTNNGPVRVERSAANDRQREAQVARQMQEQREQRRTIEARQSTEIGTPRPSPTSGRHGGETRPDAIESRREPARVALPPSPVVARGSTRGAPPPPKHGEPKLRETGRPSEPGAQPIANQAPDRVPDEPARSSAHPSPLDQRRAPAPRAPSAAEQARQRVIGQEPAAQPSAAEQQQQARDRAAEVQARAQDRAQDQQEQARRRLAEQQARAREEAADHQPAAAGQPAPQQAQRFREERQAQDQQAQVRVQQQREQTNRQLQLRQDQAQERQAQAAAQTREQQADAAERAREQEQKAKAQVREQQQAVSDRMHEQQARAAEKAQQQREKAQQQAQAREERQAHAAQQAKEQESRVAEQARQQQQQAQEQKARAAELAQQEQERVRRQAESIRPQQQNLAPTGRVQAPPPKKAPPKDQSDDDNRKKKDKGGE